MSLFDGSVSVQGAVFRVGAGVRRMTLQREYGFTAATLSAEFDPSILLDRLPGIVQRTVRDRVPMRALMHFVDDETEAYAGHLDDPNVALERERVVQESIVLTSRSILGLLIDDDERDPNNRITRTWYRKDWGEVVADVVRMRRLDPILVKDANLVARDPVDNPSPIFSVVNALPSEIVSKAVAATGFPANVFADGTFYFSRRPPDVRSGIAVTLQFRRGSEGGIRRLSAPGGRINNIVLDVDVPKIEPGSQIRIMVVGEGALDDALSGEYFVTKATLVDSTTVGESGGSYDLLPELPGLGGA